MMDTSKLEKTTALTPEINKSFSETAKMFFPEATTEQMAQANITSLYDDFYDYFDTMYIDYPLALKSVPIWEMGIKITVYAIIILLAIVGNLLIIIVVAKNKRMQSTTNFFIVNLAVSDLLVTVCCTWVHLVDNLTEGWVLGNFFCKVNSFAQGETLLQRRKKTVRFSKEETLLILSAYREHPTRWADVLADVKENIDRLPDATRDLYTNSSQRKLTDRMSAKLGKLMATRGQIEDEDIRREVDLIRDNERRHVRNVPAAPAVQPDDLSDHEQNNQADEQDNDQPTAADRRADIAAAITDTKSDGEPAEQAEPQRRRRRRLLANLMRENHELYNDFMKRKMPRLMRHFGLDSSSDD